MTIALSAELRELLGKKTYGHVVTVNADGSPQVSMVWLDVRNGGASFNTSTRTKKARNLARDPRITISVQNPDDLQQYAVLRGTAVLSETPASEQINRLAKKFLGVDVYPWRRPGETRITVDITLDRVSGAGPWVAGARGD